MNAFTKFTLAVLAAIFSFAAMAAPAVVEGEELKQLVVTEKGTTWMLSNPASSQITFMPGGKIFACEIPPGGRLNCDSGTYVVTGQAVEMKMEKWFAKSGGARTLSIKKEEEKLLLNDFTVVQYSPVATLLPPTEAEISARYATKRAAAQAYLARDKIKMKANIINDGGKLTVLDVEIYPTRGKMQIFKSSSHCEFGIQDALLSITPEGDLVVSRPERMAGCGNLHIALNPETKGIKVYVSPSVSFSDPGKVNVNNNWKLDS